MTLKYNIVTHGSFANLTVLYDGELYQASNDHAKFDEMVTLAKAGDESVIQLFSPEKAIAESFQKVSERVSIKSGHVYLDNEVIDGALTDQIVRFHEAGEDFSPLVKFLENVSSNPNADSRAQLYTFVRANNITIDSDGLLVLYKGLRASYNNGEMKYTSISRGRAIVDGVQHEGNIPNYPSAVVEMPRSSVTFNPHEACNVGLHAGAYAYARSFAQGALMTVFVNPRDVVSVPVDFSYQKVRVCRYVVGDIIDQEIQSPYRSTELLEAEDEVLDEEYDDNDDFEEDDECCTWCAQESENFTYDDEIDSVFSNTEDIQDDAEAQTLKISTTVDDDVAQWGSPSLITNFGNWGSN